MRVCLRFLNLSEKLVYSIFATQCLTLKSCQTTKLLLFPHYLCSPLDSIHNILDTFLITPLFPPNKKRSSEASLVYDFKNNAVVLFSWNNFLHPSQKNSRTWVSPSEVISLEHVEQKDVAQWGVIKA